MHPEAHPRNPSYKSKKSSCLFIWIFIILFQSCGNIPLCTFLHFRALPGQPFRAIRFVMPLLVTEEAYNFWLVPSSGLSSTALHCHCFVIMMNLWCAAGAAWLGAQNLADLLIEQAGDHVAQSELIRWCWVEIDNNDIIGGRKAHCKGKNFVLITDCDASLFKTKYKGLDLSNPCLHSVGGGLLECEKFLAECKTCSKACSMMNTLQNKPNCMWIICLEAMR